MKVSNIIDITGISEECINEEDLHELEHWVRLIIRIGKRSNKIFNPYIVSRKKIITQISDDHFYTVRRICGKTCCGLDPTVPERIPHMMPFTGDEKYELRIPSTIFGKTIVLRK
jgi:hypothetical protein